MSTEQTECAGQSSSHHAQVPGASTTAATGHPELEVLLSRLTALTPEGWQALSIRERFKNIKESHLRLHPSEDVKLAALYAAYWTMTLDSLRLHNMSDQAMIEQKSYYTLIEWKECVDEHKVLDIGQPGSQLNDKDTKIYKAVCFAHSGASYLSSFLAALRLNNSPPENTSEGISQLTPASPGEDDHPPHEDGLDPEEQTESAEKGKAKKKRKGKKKKKKTQQAPIVSLGNFPIASELREEDALPEGFEDTGPGGIYDGDPIISESFATATCIPALPSGDKLRHPDGHSIWWTSPASKRRYLANTSWPKPVPKFPVKFVVKETEDGTGMGVFATQNIKRFEPILVERPYLVVPAAPVALAAPSSEAYKKLTPVQARQLEMKIAETKYGPALDTFMTPELKEDFMSLANSHKHDGSGPILGIIRTNGFGALFNQALPGVDQDYGLPYSAVGKIASRFNHSCIPNVTYFGFEPVTFTLRFAAALDIKAGSQMFVNYVDLGFPKEERQQKLLRYGFECTCRACVNATPESDKLRTSCVKMITDWAKQAESDWLKKPNLRESMLRPLLDAKKHMEKDGLDNHEMGYFNLLFIIRQVYEKVGNRKKAKEIEELLERSNMRHGWKLVSNWMEGRW